MEKKRLVLKFAEGFGTYVAGEIHEISRCSAPSDRRRRFSRQAARRENRHPVIIRRRPTAARDRSSPGPAPRAGTPARRGMRAWAKTCHNP